MFRFKHFTSKLFLSNGIKSHRISVNGCNRTKHRSKPEFLPYIPTEENVSKFEQYILEKFAASAFDKSSPFPTMSRPSALIHMKSNAKPYSVIHLFLYRICKASLNLDVADVIITPVPVSCSNMIIPQKKDGKTGCTVDLHQPNFQCLREKYHCQSSFQFLSDPSHIPRKAITINFTLMIH